jgi:hypothetical protein
MRRFYAMRWLMPYGGLRHAAVYAMRWFTPYGGLRKTCFAHWYFFRGPRVLVNGSSTLPPGLKSKSGRSAAARTSSNQSIARRYSVGIRPHACWRGSNCQSPNYVRRITARSSSRPSRRSSLRSCSRSQCGARRRSRGFGRRAALRH